MKSIFDDYNWSPKTHYDMWKEFARDRGFNSIEEMLTSMYPNYSVNEMGRIFGVGHLNVRRKLAYMGVKIKKRGGKNNPAGRAKWMRYFDFDRWFYNNYDLIVEMGVIEKQKKNTLYFRNVENMLLKFLFSFLQPKRLIEVTDNKTHFELFLKSCPGLLCIDEGTTEKQCIEDRVISFCLQSSYDAWIQRRLREGLPTRYHEVAKLPFTPFSFYNEEVVGNEVRKEDFVYLNCHENAVGMRSELFQAMSKKAMVVFFTKMNLTLGREVICDIVKEFNEDEKLPSYIVFTLRGDQFAIIVREDIVEKTSLTF